MVLLLPKLYKLYVFQSLILSVLDEDYSRKVSCALNAIYAFIIFIHHFIVYLTLFPYIYVYGVFVMPLCLNVQTSL